MTVDEYRKKHKRCKTCVYAEIKFSYCWRCKAKCKSFDSDLERTILKGKFCKLYKAREEYNARK